eukprot:6457461-Amphidinium_carterae.2
MQGLVCNCSSEGILAQLLEVEALCCNRCNVSLAIVSGCSKHLRTLQCGMPPSKVVVNLSLNFSVTSVDASRRL